MEMNAQFAIWGIFFMSIMYIVGNVVWTNHLARRRLWWGWFLWLLSGIAIVIIGHSLGNYLGGKSGVDALFITLKESNLESYWIIFSLYALMSVPGAGCVIFKQPKSVTLMTLLLPALVVFIPSSIALQQETNIQWLLGIFIPICTLIWLSQHMLDVEPNHQTQASNS